MNEFIRTDHSNNLIKVYILQITTKKTFVNISINSLNFIRACIRNILQATSRKLKEGSTSSSKLLKKEKGNTNSYLTLFGIAAVISKRCSLNKLLANSNNTLYFTFRSNKNHILYNFTINNMSTYHFHYSPLQLKSE